MFGNAETTRRLAQDRIRGMRADAETRRRRALSRRGRGRPAVPADRL